MRFAALLLAGLSLAAQIQLPQYRGVIAGSQGAAPAYTYYVDSAAPDDNGAGTSPATAWKTIAKVNATTLTAGQSVGFKRGGTWRETLTPGQSGSAGSPITYAAYGSGADPILTGLMPLVSGAWTADAGTYDWQFDNETALPGDWTSETDASSVLNRTNTAAAVHSGSYGIQLDVATGATAYLSKTVTLSTGNWYYQIYFKLSSDFAIGSANKKFCFLNMKNSATDKIWIYLKDTGATKILRLETNQGVVAIAQDGATNISLNAWHSLKIYVLNGNANSSTNEYHLLLDGNAEITGTAKTLDASHNANINTILVGAQLWSGTPSPAGSLYFDDGYYDLDDATTAVANVWNATVTASAVHAVQFGGIWTTPQASKAACTAARGWYFSGNTLSVYATSNPATYYGSVNASMLGALIDVNAKTDLTFKNLKVAGYDTYGVQTRGAADRIRFEYVTADSNVPRIDATGPDGFHLVSTVSPATIVAYHSDAFRNYNGFVSTVSGVAAQYCRAFANRNLGFYDNGTAANLTYSNSAAFGNNISGGTFDVAAKDYSGGTDGGGNAQPYTDPGFTALNSFPVYVSVTFDDIGGNASLAPWVTSTMATVFSTRSVPFNVAAETSASGSLVSTLQGWLTAGNGVDSHSYSHAYFNQPAMTVQYTGNGSTATMTISGNTLSTTLSGQSDGSANLSLDLTNASYDTIAELSAYINGLTGYSCSGLQASATGSANSKNLADVAAQSIKTAYQAQWSESRLIPDEMALSKAWLEANLTGYSAVSFVYPGTFEDTSTEGYAVAAGYLGGRGYSINGNNMTVILPVGVNVQNIMSQGGVVIHGQTQQQIQGWTAAYLMKAAAWGLPLGIYIHYNEATAAEVGYMLDALIAGGAHIVTNAQMVTWLRGLTNTSGTSWAVGAN